MRALRKYFREELMKQTRAATQATRLICELRGTFKDLPRFCREAHEISLNDDGVRQKLYDKLWKDGVRTIEGVLEHCEQAASILRRRGLNAETRVAALWFTLFGHDAGNIENAVELSKRRLENTDSEYNVAELPKLLGAEKAKPLVILWQQYAALCARLAARVAFVLTYRRAIRFWALYVAVVRRDELAAVIRELRRGKHLKRDLVFRLVRGEEGSVSLESFDSDWKAFEHRKSFEDKKVLDKPALK